MLQRLSTTRRSTAGRHVLRRSAPGRGILNGRLARTAATTLALCLISGVGTASAYWAMAAYGTGTAANSAMRTVTVDAFIPGDTPQTTLVPGGTADVVLRATNPNPFPVQVYAVTTNGPAVADESHPACTVTGVSFLPPAAPLAPTVSIPANTSELITLTGAASMSTASQSTCQGSTFHLPVTMEVRR